MKNIDTKLSFLYCFDTKYNNQAFSSMISLLDYIDEEIDIYILHNDLSQLNIPEKIQYHHNLNKYCNYEFKDTNYNFPNLSENHISVATYYRMFLDNYLPKDLESIIYIDSDIICLTNPKEKILKELNNLRNSDYTLAAKTEINLNKINSEKLNRLKKTNFFKKFWPFDRLPLEDKYFNAGFLIIDLNKWRSRNIQKKLIRSMEEQYLNIFMWDQDVLNCVFNGKYLDLNSEVNFEASKYNNNSKIPYFLHFSGSNKPWKTNGAFNFSSKFYHLNYEKFSNIKYHIETENKKNSLKDLFINIINFEIFKINNPITYLIIFYKTLRRR